MTNFRTAMVAVAVAAALAGSTMASSGAMAADGTLAPGKPAGVHQARRHLSRAWVIGGVALLTVGGIAIGLATTNNSQCTTACVPSSTTSTGN